jgi:hypothetical protein
MAQRYNEPEGIFKMDCSTRDEANPGYGSNSLLFGTQRIEYMDIELTKKNNYINYFFEDIIRN